MYDTWLIYTTVIVISTTIASILFIEKYDASKFLMMTYLLNYEK